MEPRTWDIFCRVVDNFGDIGVCWRLAADLAARGESVRLWADDVSALRWMAPAGAFGVLVTEWGRNTPWPEPGDVVIEAFGCDPPAEFVARMAARPHPPLWINLEYLSAEACVERNHRLRSPHAGSGLVKWFFYPGFTAATGGLIRETDLSVRQQRFDAAAWLSTIGVERREGERLVSLFCYEQANLAALLAPLTAAPTRLLVAAGIAAQQVEAWLGSSMQADRLEAVLLRPLTQSDYDHLLWSCDLNFVRGEDSFVRAQWAGAPFVWQIYPQHDGAHAVKLDAFLTRHLAKTEPTLAASVDALWHAWNGLPHAASAWPEPAAWRRHSQAWRDALWRQTDLARQLLDLADESAPPESP